MNVHSSSKVPWFHNPHIAVTTIGEGQEGGRKDKGKGGGRK